MKKITFLMVLVALGVATLSCNDQDFSDVERTVQEENIMLTDDAREIIAKPGQ